MFDETFVFSIGIRIGGNDAFLFGPEFREIVLADIEFDLEIVEIGHGDDVAFGAFVADETGGDEFAFFDVTVKIVPVMGARIIVLSSWVCA